MEDAIETLSAVASVVIVIPFPATNVKVSDALSATTLLCPETAMVLNASEAPPPPPPPPEIAAVEIPVILPLESTTITGVAPESPYVSAEAPVNPVRLEPEPLNVVAVRVPLFGL